MGGSGGSVCGINLCARNLRYGLSPDTGVEEVIEAGGIAACDGTAGRGGLDTPLGEGGGLVSGGEGQRVRLARANAAPDMRLVILDELSATRFEQRGVLLARAREHWKDATLLSISHNISENDGVRTGVGDRRRPRC